MKLTFDIPDNAIKLVALDEEKYLGPLLIAMGAQILASIRDAQVDSQPIEEKSND